VEHLINLLLIAAFAIGAFVIDRVFEGFGRTRFLTMGTLAGLVAGSAAGLLGYGMVSGEVSFGGVTTGTALLVLGAGIWVGLVVRNFKRASAPLWALAGTALQLVIAYVAGPSIMAIAVFFLLAAASGVFLQLLPSVQGVVPVVNGKPLRQR